MVVKNEFSCSTLWEIIFAKQFTKLLSRALPIKEVKIWCKMKFFAK